jgi:predicted ATPase
MEEALKLADELDHPYTNAQAAILACTFHQLMRQWTQCQAQAEKATELTSQGHFRFLQAGGTMVRGSVLAQQGHVEEGIAVLQQGLDAWEATGTQLALPYSHARLAEAYLLGGRREEGLQALEGACGCAEEIWWLPEQCRLRAELLLLASGHEIEAEAALQQALEVAHDQGSRSLELRAATSLARLWQSQGKVTEGRELLAECYAWFTEGFSTPDLREARVLLGELAPTLQEQSDETVCTMH